MILLIFEKPLSPHMLFHQGMCDPFFYWLPLFFHKMAAQILAPDKICLILLKF